MQVADPFGSWVKGAQEGQQSAIALRNAEDEAAQRAYNLQIAQQTDPLRYNMLKNQSETSDLELGANKDIYGAKFPQQLSAADLEGKQLRNVEARVGMGDISSYIPFAASHGGQFTPTGAIQYPVMGADGQVHYAATPPERLGSQQAYHNMLMQQYQQARVQAQLRGQDLRFDEWMGGHPNASGSIDYGHPLSGLPGLNGQPPAAHTTTPNANQPIDLRNPYNMPSGSFTTPLGIGYSPMVEHGSVGVGGGSSFLGREIGGKYARQY